MDVDHFKAVNDTYGHDAGDDVLRHLAAVLRSFGRESDLVGRYGGEEFVVVMPETDAQDVRYAAERLRKLICRQPLQLESVAVNISVSLGIASLPATAGADANPPLSGRDLIALADKALYVAKDRGRNNSVHYDEIANGSVDGIQTPQCAAGQ
jgi:diguanylate cyclase (GGDEF)-like protein